VPGTPNVSVSGTPTYGGTVAGTESAQPAGYAVTITGNATLRHLVTRTDPIQLGPVAAPPAPAGTRDVSLTQAGQTVGDSSTLRHLTLSGKAGAVSVPPGTYGRLAASSNTAFVLGVQNSQQPSAYNLESLSLSGNSELRVVGPVLLTVSNGVTLTGSTAGSGNDPRQLVLQVSGGGVGVGGGGVLYAVVRAPQSVVTIDGKGRVRGTVSCDRLTVAGGGVLQVTEADLPPPPVNRFPTVNAGPDQTITLPADTVSLSGSASDDGLPAGSTLTTAWSKVSGPGAVTFADASSPTTTATFAADGTYVLRLSASDTRLTAFADVSVTVLPANLPPAANAGPDKSALLGVNLLQNAGCESALVENKIPSWASPDGGAWAQGAGAVGGPPFSVEGDAYFYPSGAGATELRQDVDVSAFAASVDGGAQRFEFKGYVRAGTGATPDGARVVVEYRDAANASVLSSFDSSELTPAEWSQVADTRAAPAGTRWIRVRLISSEHDGLAGGGLFDSLSLRAVSAAAVSLDGAVTDDGLPAGASLTAAWSVVSGPGQVRFANPSAAATTATFDQAGTYVLRLTASDSQFNNADDVTVTVAAANLPPSVSAGPDASATVARPLTLAGAASDDGLPAGSALLFNWIKASGPGSVTFADAHALSTTATFDQPGAYALRLTAVDSEYAFSDEVRVTVSPANAAPTVNAGADQSVSLPASAGLSGSVSDDGLPSGAVLTVTWTKASGPGTVTFADAHAAATTASFSAPGTYVLRLSASDTELSSSDDVTVVVYPSNQPPAVNAGPAQTVTMPTNSLSLNGTVTDDGLPAGAQLSARWSVVGSSPVQSPTFFGDDFNDNSFDTTKWQSFQIDAIGAQVVERNSRLEFVPGIQSGGGFFRSNGYRDMREHVVTVKFGGCNIPMGQDARFRVRDDGAATTFWAGISDGSPGMIRFFADSFFDGKNREDGAGFAYDGTSPVWLRFRESGQSYYWDTSTDGVNWTPRVAASFFRPPTTAQYFRFDYYSPVGGPVIYIDDFAMTSPAWDAIAGPGTVAFADPNSPATTATFSDAGVYTLRLTASDTEFERTSDVTVTVNPANHPPVVNAGQTQTVLLADGAKLFGVVSDEGLPVGAPVTVQWSKVSGPGSVSFSDPNSTNTTATFDTVGYYVLRLSASDTQLTGTGDVLVKVIASYQGQPGGVFVTGHDADDHSQGPGLPGIGAQHVVQRAIQYVTYNKTSPKILLATDLRNPGGDQSDPRNGLRVSGYNTFDVADYGSGTPGVLDLHTVNFSNYDVVVVASDFGCWLRQEELDVLNARSAELLDYVNQGGGIVAFAESGGRPVPPGTYTGTTHDRFRFIPFVVSSEDFQEAETGITVTPDGAAIGLTNDDVSGNYSHNIFTTTGGMTVIDRDPFNQILSLAVRGKHISPDGIGNDAPVVSAGASRTTTLPNGVALAGVASDDGLPAGSTLAILWRKISGPGTVTFDSPNQVNIQAFFTDPGTYVLRLSASDGQLSSFGDVAVTVNPTGQFVVVNAGPDQSIYLPNAVTLQAAVSDGRVSTAQPLTLRWSVLDGPGAVTFSNPSALATTAAFSAAGLYTLRFSAGDAQYTGTDDLVVKVRPQPVNFGDDFDDNTNDPSKWFYGPGITERNQQLQIDVPDSASLSEFVSAVPVDMTADGAYVRFEIPDYADPTLSNNRIIYWRMQASEGHWFQWVYNNGGVHMYLDNTLLVTNTRTRFWRVIHFAANDRVNYDMSEDGVNWVNRYSLVGPYSFTFDHLTFRLIVGAQGPGAAGTVKIDNVNSNIPLIKPNQPPTPVTGGPYRATLGVPLQLDGSRSTDPGDVITAYAWDFGDGSTGAGATPTHTYADAGLYTVRLTVTDLDGATGTATTTATVVPPNQPPTVNAGADQTITLPSTASLSGSVSDDGLPAGGALVTQWSVVSGPGAVTFADASKPVTSASFAADGTYVLRLSASDSDLSASDDVTVTVNPAPPNQPPTASVGEDQTVTPGLNLVRNPGGEEPVVAGVIPGWTKAEGDTWAQAPAGTQGFYESFDGDTYFYAAGDAHAELRQDVDVSAYAASIATGAQQFAFVARVRAGAETPADSARVVFEFRDATNANVLATVDSGEITTSEAWQSVEGAFPAPAGAAFVRVRLLATRNSGQTTDAYFDAISVRAVANAAAKLNGAVTDDGLPFGSTTTATWSVVSGPGAVAFADAHAASTSATFAQPGAYVLRLSASDTLLTSSDDVTVNVTAPNAAPNVSAGADETITLPTNTASLAGAISDDGLPQGRSVSARWRKVGGPGDVTFADASAAQTTATFSAAGNYVLRLTADDSDLSASDEVIITVKAAPVNQPPVVEAGPDQSVSLPDHASLAGQATDDGLPSGGALTYSWSVVSGPGAVTFSNPASLTTAAAFAAEGVYTLRLTASDSQLSSSDTLTVTVHAAGTNNAPVVNAGPDTEVRLPDAATLSGSATDDGLPSGSTLAVAWSVVSGPGTVTFASPTSARTQAAFASSGTYVLRLAASDTALTSSDDLTVTVYDPVNGPAPTVDMTSLADGEEVTAPKIITGTVSGGAWRLEYALIEDETAPVQQWHTFASGSGAVSNAPLGTFDPTVLLNGTYAVRLVSTDSSGQTSEKDASVVVARQMKVGNFTVSFNDLSVPVAGIPVQVTRTYDSRDKRQGDFGVGWTLGVSSARVQKTVPVGADWYETESFASIRTYCLQSTRPQLVTVTFGDGKVYKFQAAPAQQCQRFQPFSTVQMTFTPMPGTRGTLTPLDGGSIVVAGSVPGPVEFVDTGDPSGYYFNPTRFRLTTEDGTSFVLGQKAGVESVSTPAGETLTITRDGITHSSGESVTFVRDAAGRIDEIRDPAGRSRFYTYDSGGDLESFRDAEGDTTRFTYADDHFLTGIEVTSADGQHSFKSATSAYENGRLTGQTDADGLEVKFGHDIDNRRETITDKLGNTTVYEYDSRGNVLRTVDAKGGVKTFTYDADDNVLTVTNAIGKTTTYTYDAAGHRTSETDPLGNVTRYTYDALGQVLTTADALGRVTTNVYNEQTGNLLSTLDAEGNETRYEYQPLGSLRTAMIRISKDDPAHPLVTGYGYDRIGELISESDPSGDVTTYSYDADGNRLSQTITRTRADGTQEEVKTSYEYDRENRPTKTIYPDGTTASVVYNEQGKQSSAKDQLGRETKYEYDAQGRITRTVFPDGSAEETTYDAEGHRTKLVDVAGRATTYSYDELGRLVKTTFADGTFTTTAYDAIGRVVATTDERGNKTTYEYDPNCGCSGRKSKVTDALGHMTTFSYDGVGNQVSMTDGKGRTTRYEYDALNRRTKSVYPDGTSIAATYDAWGRTASKSDQAGRAMQFEYDPAGRLVKVTDALGQATTYTYDEAGDQITQTDANGHTTRYEYDAMGRLTSRTDFSSKTTTYTYDLMGRLLAKTPDPSLGEPAVGFTYTAAGMRETMTDATGVTTYAYDARDRLKSKATPRGTLTYSYDAAGNLLTVRSSNADGVSVDYGYDELNRLSAVKDNRLPAAANTTTYGYDAVGNLESYTYPNAVRTAHSYDSLNRLTGMTAANASSTVASYAYMLGATGNRLSVAELGGRTVSYAYDALYRLTGETVAGDQTSANNGQVGYTYDAAGNRLTRTSTIPAIMGQTFAYDADDRLTSDTYDPNGNAKQSQGSSYAYDFENRLVSVNDGAVAYAYDGDGNRVSKTVGGVTTTYLVDTNNPTGYAQVVEELQGGQVFRQYTYGTDLISQRQLISNQWSVSYYGFDGHGSVRFLTDSTGAVTDAYAYDAFGNLLSASGGTPNEYLYAGQRRDPETGFYHLRARYMNPSEGRFLTVDSFEGDNDDPQSLHEYLFVGANPVNKVDPSGHEGIGEQTVAVEVNEVLSGIVAVAAYVVLQEVQKKLDEDSGIYIYRRGNPNSMKTTALYREDDWKTGLSFSTKPPADKYLKFKVINLLIAGFAVFPDGGRPFTNIIDGTPFSDRVAGPDHVSVFLPDRARWDAWYNAEKGNTTQNPFVPNSEETSNLYSLRELLP
jgi:RHS repeat-associated protein